ncbi:MAG: molybdenum cofactor biosynthesis protein MoaE [Phycisphaerales bacterium]
MNIVDGPLTRTEIPAIAGAGAVLVFEGIARPTEDTRPIDALDYQAYEPMASNELTALASDVLTRHGLLAISVTHSRGRVPAGKCSFRLVVWSRHRREAIAAIDDFIDRLKRDVPIWKSPVWTTQKIP